MALLNNIYVLVEKEDLDNDVETVTHPTETGFPTASSVRKSPVSLSISGKIANTDELTAKQIIEKLKKLQKDGSLIRYEGQCGAINNLQIQSFKDSYNYKNYGGADFSMSLIEVKIAKSAYVASEKKIEKIESKPVTFSKGDTVVFGGGHVYLSSDATKPSSTRDYGSYCEITHTALNNKHPYHLVSKDCSWGSRKYVFGWVDEGRLFAVSETTQGSTNGGTQQVQSTQKNVIYHTVKKGETIYGICHKTYKSYGFSVSKVIKDNPKAFSKPNDAKTLQIGAKLVLKKDGGTVAVNK